jgi:putative ABC transport system permease protein
MIKHYITIAFRNISRSKIHSIINVLGLSLGVATCILIALFVKDEWTFDHFHKKADRIYRVWLLEDYGPDEQFFSTVTPFPMGPALKENFSEVEQEVRFNGFTAQIRIEQENFTQDIALAGQNFFEVFDFDFIAGDKAQALRRQDDVIITKRTAEFLFGENSAMGKTISIEFRNEFRDFTVRGVINNIPGNSSLQFNMLLSDLNYPLIYNERILTSAWFNINPETYILIRDDASADDLQHKFPALFRQILGEDFKGEYNVGLQPLTDIHLNTAFPEGIAPVSDPRYANILASIALLILLLACINFVTLAVGRSLKRAKEVGIRKVSGAARVQLVSQFIGEALVITIISLSVGIILAYLGLPLFNQLAAKNLVIEWNAFMWILVIGLLLTIGIVAGSYPALVLSGFKPINILKGNVTSGNSKQSMRKVLVGVQLVLSIFLVSSTLVMQRQLNFLRSKNLGYNKEQMVVVQLNASPGNMTDRINQGFTIAETFKAELSKYPEILAVAASGHTFGVPGWTNAGYTDENSLYRTFNLNYIDAEYISTFEMEMLAGRNFQADNPADNRRSILVNEALVREYGWDDAIGKRLPGKNFEDHEIIGVVKDFNYSSLYNKVEPLVMVMNPAGMLAGIENINIRGTPVPKLMIRIGAGVIPDALDKIEATWKKLSGDQEFAFSFIEETLALQYAQDQNLGKIVRIATLLAMLIGSLGLYALASLALQNRTKEISIRKVFGATQRSLMLMLSKDYIYLVLICVLLSVPATWYLMDTWLQSFSYRISIGWDIFLLSGVIALLIAFMVISYQIIKTAFTSPSETLKYE